MRRSELALILRRLAHCDGMETCEECPFDQEVCRCEDTAAILKEAAQILEADYKRNDHDTRELGNVISKNLATLRRESNLTYPELVEKMKKYFYEDENGSNHTIGRTTAISHEQNGGSYKTSCARMPVETLVWYANVYDVSTDWLLGRTERRN